MAKTKKTDEGLFQIPFMLKDYFQSLANADAGALFGALAEYHYHGKEPSDLSERLHGAFEVLKYVTAMDFTV